MSDYQALLDELRELAAEPLAKDSPAHAGIGPRFIRRWGRGRRFPRTRGDRPGSLESMNRTRSIPPHTRG